MGSNFSPDATVYITTAVLWNIYVIGTTVLFFFLQKNDFIRKRNVSACLFQVLFSLICGNAWLARANLWPTISGSFPWIIAVLSSYFSVINWLFSYGARTIILLNDYYSAKIASMINKKSGMKTEDDMLQLLRLSRAEKIAFKLQKKLISVGQPPLISQDRQETVALLTNKVGVIKGIGFPALLKLFIYLGIAEFFLVLIVIGYSGGYSNKALTPSFNAGGLEWIPLYFGIVVFLLAVPAFAYLLRNVKDSLYLRLEQTVAFTLFYPFFILYLLTYFVRPVAATFTFGYTFWLVILLTILHTVTVTTPALYVLFKKDSSDQKALLNNSLESFSRVLNDSFLFAELKKILVENFAIENALFLEEFDVLVPSGMSRQTHTILDADGTQLQIQSIIRNFIVSGAPNELNITSKTRKAIVAAWQRGGQLSADILEPAKEEVVQMMYQNSYPRLLRKIASAKKKQATV